VRVNLKRIPAQPREARSVATDTDDNVAQTVPYETTM
jgi:hypothetical protein